MDVVQGLDDGVHVGDDLVRGTLVKVQVYPAGQDRDNGTRNNKDEHFQRPLTHPGRVTLWSSYESVFSFIIYPPDTRERG